MAAIEGPELNEVAALLGVAPEAVVFALTNRQIQSSSRSSIAVKHLGALLIVHIDVYHA